MKLVGECGNRAKAEEAVRAMREAVVMTAVLDLQRGSRG
jgi:hypothetical protein